ncbi:MAG TPA: glycosyltransferase [Xanthobacteraceae bacterium]|jgi:glycosyltransferase involved in cell wall biosynthesis|nr:glycosyltransferase [Xanthobacteraceae bacterium]
MRIGYVARWWPEFGGSYHYDRFAIAALRRAAPDAELLVFYADDQLPRDLASLAGGVVFIKLIDGATSMRLFPRLVRRVIRFFYEMLSVQPIVFANLELKKHRLDVCISTAPFVDGVFADCANVLMVHDLWYRRYEVKHWAVSRVDWWSLRTQVGIWNSDLFIVESPLGKHDLQEFGKLDEKRVKVVPLPAAPFVAQYVDERLPLPEIVSSPYILYPAHFLPFKNHAVILRALLHLRVKGLRLCAVFCGPVTAPDYRNQVAQLVEELELEDQVVLQGFVSDRDLAALYQHATAVVMASKFGPTNMPIWEAMAFGTPIVSCDVGDMPWQVGEAGLIFPVDDDAVLASHLELLVNDSELAAEYVRRGKKKFSSLRQAEWGMVFLDAVQQAILLHETEPPWKASDIGPLV